MCAMCVRRSHGAAAAAGRKSVREPSAAAHVVTTRRVRIRSTATATATATRRLSRGACWRDGGVMDERLCLAPQLCIRCRSYDVDDDVYDGHRVVVVSNVDACTCPDDRTCSHSKNPLKKKISLVSTTTIRVHDDDEEFRRTRTESDDEFSSSSSSSSSSSDSEESTSS